MRLRLKQINKMHISLSNVFVLSLVLTMVILLVKKNDVLIQISLFSEDSLKKLQDQLNSGNPMLTFVIKERLAIIFLLFVVATTSLSNIFVYMNVLWYGMNSGMFLTIVLMRYGIKGILLLLAGMFPHYLIYVPAMILTLHITKEKRMVNSKFCLQLLVICIVVIIGCVLECYVNPQIVAKMLKKF